MFRNKNILITGGTGTIGKEIVKRLFKLSPKTIRIYSRDETEQFYMKNELNNHPKLRFLVGDVRDKERLKLAMNDINVVFHTAALKHVESCEYNPFEAVKTNVIGIQNIIDTALESNVERVIYTSSDKAANPNNTMGATKLLGERLMISANFFKGKKKTIFASVRFGNVMGSRGSVIPLFKKQIRSTKTITITNPEMTRFMMTMTQAIDLVFKCTKLATGGEIFILKMPVLRLKDLAKIIIDEYTPKFNIDPKSIMIKEIGIKNGETMYEELMTEEESMRALETKNMFIIPINIENYTKKLKKYKISFRKVKKYCKYDSRDQKVLNIEDVKRLLKKEKIV
jgi:UDP-N-acetylglucosamine 4,6-dehydratase/5-epimerase